MKMGNCTSKEGGAKRVSEPKNFFENEKMKEQLRQQAIADAAANKDVPKAPTIKKVQPPPDRQPKPSAPTMTYDQEAIDRMRNQLKNDPTSFLLNNIMLSIQFFENYDRMVYDLKNNSVSTSDVVLNDNMAQHQKHVFFPDKLQEAVDGNVQFIRRHEEPEETRDYRPRTAMSLSRRSRLVEPLQPQRMYVVHDNVEVDEPGEVSDYSTVMGTPFYKMLLEESDEPGYVKLRKTEVLDAAPQKMSSEIITPKDSSDKSSESGRDSVSSNESSKEEGHSESINFMNDLEKRIKQPPKPAFIKPEGVRNIKPLAINSEINNNSAYGGNTERRLSGILKNTTPAVVKGQLDRVEKTKKNSKRDNSLNKKGSIGSESSGYQTSYSPQTESSGNESDYGYATITAEATPKRLEKSIKARTSDSTSIIPQRCITVVKVKRTPGNLDSTDEEYEARYGDFQRDLYKSIYYLNSTIFMSNFNDLFVMRLATPLGFNQNYLDEALTQGASIYCNIIKAQTNKAYEVIPAINSQWPYAANGWLLRYRKIITNPRTNFTYQWPTAHMIIKAKGLGCLITPLGFRPTRGSNPQQGLQWKLTFPAVERYLETCMAHSQVRCYLFTITMFKTFMENEPSSIGINNTHFKNHLFWQLEDNFAKWPEDRLGEAFILYLKSFYEHLMRSNLPDYFIPQCNMLKGIPKPVLLKQQRRLADILQSPVMHLLACLRNLKYVKANYYPVLKYKRLYNILTTTDILNLINPDLPRVDNVDIDEEELAEVGKGLNIWDTIKRKENPEYVWQMEQLRQIEAKKAARTLVMNNGILKNYIDRKRKIVDFETHRKRLVLQLFIPHFVSMAEWSIKFDAGKQAMIYLDQAQRLTILLTEEPGGELKAEEYMEMIREHMNFIKSNVPKTGAPKVPKRNESFNSNLTTVTDSRINNQNLQFANAVKSKAMENEDKGNLDSPTLKFSGVIFADVHVDIEKTKLQHGVSRDKVMEEPEDDIMEESRL